MTFSGAARAMTLDWSGLYRFEWTQIERPTLDDVSRKAYGLNYLSLSPKIIATDGVNINAKFDVLSPEDDAYAFGQTGQIWGTRASTSGNTNTLAQSKKGSALGVRELYMTVNQEYGTLLVGRAPIEFGLGLVWNAGNGAFDHWGTNSDLVAFKFYVGNLQFMPMISRVSVPSKSTEQINVVQDQGFQVMYESEESGSMIGAMISRRQSSLGSNDVPNGSAGLIGGAGATVTGPLSLETKSFVLGRTWESFKFKMEAAFVDGSYGVTDTTGAQVKSRGYGIALNLDFPRPLSKWEWSSKLGIASGDNPTTSDNEGFIFNRNYDVAMLLFNHRLGQKDFLQTNMIKETTAHTVSNSLDDEAVSNALYLAPKLRYRISDRFSLDNTLIYAQLVNAPASTATDLKKDLGTEWDIALHYKPRANMIWTNELGLLFPGGAFKEGSSNLNNGFAFGFSTKTAITF